MTSSHKNYTIAKQNSTYFLFWHLPILWSPLFSLSLYIKTFKHLYLTHHSLDIMLSLNNFIFFLVFICRWLPNIFYQSKSFSMNILIYPLSPGHLHLLHKHIEFSNNKILNPTSACALYFTFHQGLPWTGPSSPHNQLSSLDYFITYFPSLYHPLTLCPGSGLLNLLTRLFQQTPNWSLILDLFFMLLPTCF